MAFEGTGKMGRSHEKIFRLILLASVLFSVPGLYADSDSGVAATATDLVMPHYRKNELQFVLYGGKVVNLGATITLENPLIDIAVRNLPDVELVTLLKGVRPPDPRIPKITAIDPTRVYPLYTEFKLIREFWKRLPHSQALISSGSAKYDKNKRILSGDGTIHFRSRDLDIDGVGFDADQRKKFIHIRSKVRVEYRPNARPLTQEAKKILEEKWQKLKERNSR